MKTHQRLSPSLLLLALLSTTPARAVVTFETLCTTRVISRQGNPLTLTLRKSDWVTIKGSETSWDGNFFELIDQSQPDHPRVVTRWFLAGVRRAATSPTKADITFNPHSQQIFVALCDFNGVYVLPWTLTDPPSFEEWDESHPTADQADKIALASGLRPTQAGPLTSPFITISNTGHSTITDVKAIFLSDDLLHVTTVDDGKLRSFALNPADRKVTQEQTTFTGIVHDISIFTPTGWFLNIRSDGSGKIVFGDGAPGALANVGPATFNVPELLIDLQKHSTPQNTRRSHTSVAINDSTLNQRNADTDDNAYIKKLFDQAYAQSTAPLDPKHFKDLWKTHHP